MNWKNILERLKNPKTLMSIIAQVLALLVLFGINVNQSLVLTAGAAFCAILGTIGIISYPEKNNEPWDAMLLCSRCDSVEPHVRVNGQLVCKKCGAVHPSELGGDPPTGPNA